MGINVHQVLSLPTLPNRGDFYAVQTGSHTCSLWISSRTSDTYKLVTTTGTSPTNSGPAIVETFNDLPIPDDLTAPKLFLVKDASGDERVIQGTVAYLFDPSTSTYLISSLSEGAELEPVAIVYPNEDMVIDNVATMSDFTLSVPMTALVTDASEDENVASGAAYFSYIVGTGEWVFIMLGEGGVGVNATTTLAPDIIVADIEERNALLTAEDTPNTVFVLDASDDSEISSGSATYMYNATDTNWVLTSVLTSTDSSDSITDAEIADDWNNA